MTLWTPRLPRLALASSVAGALLLAGCADTGSEQAAPVTSTVVVTSTAQPADTPTSTAAEAAAPAVTTAASTSEEPAGGPCEVSAIQQVSGYEEMDMMLYCDGDWARAALYQSDWLQVFTWAGDEWAPYRAHGETRGLGMTTGCYLAERIAADGMPAELVDKVTICDEDDLIF